MKIVKWLFITPVILIVLGVIGTEMNKAYWDDQVRAMCKKDGGVTIFEKVELSKNDYPDIKFTSTNLLILPFESKAKPDDPFFIKSNTRYISKGFPEIRRYEQSIIRNSDKKMLNKLVSYSRVGGDFPTGFHHSSYSCDKWKKNINLFSATVKLIGEQL